MTLRYPYTGAPAYGSTKEIAPGLHWLQMPLPASLRHINLYLIEEKTGWVVVDTGIRGKETRDLWEKIFSQALAGKPVSRIICTHMHPDHTGQAGFIAHRFNVPLYMSYAEYYQSRVMYTMMQEGGYSHSTEHYFRAGLSATFVKALQASRNAFSASSDDQPLPSAFIRLTDGDELQLGNHSWQVMTGSGHSPEHVCLYCPRLRMFISGDQILPSITSNVSVYPTEPEADPMSDWLASQESFKTRLPDDILVLPAHNMPFYGVKQRLQELIDHHEDRMLILEECCIKPSTAVRLLPHLFARKLEGYTRIMALGECVAHLNCLMNRGKIKRLLLDSVYHYQSIGPARTCPRGSA